MSTSGSKFREDFIRCPLCSKVYRQPRILTCLHSFCTPCLHDYILGGHKPVKGKPDVSKHATSQPDVVQTTDRKLEKPVDAKSQQQAHGKPGPKPPGKEGGTKVQPTTGGRQPTSKSPVKEQMSNSPKPGKDGTFVSAQANPKATQNDPKGKPGLTAHQDKKTVTMSTPIKDGRPTKTNEQPPHGARAPTDLSMKGFPCPCCKKFITTPALPRTTKDKWTALIPVNNLLADIVDLHSLKLGTKVCDPCRRNKTKSALHSYCKNCKDALCENCAKTHKGLRSCKNHKVLLTSEFADAISSLKVDEEYCPKHEDKLLEHYCYQHSALCCPICVDESHKSCSHVASVVEAVRKTREGNDVQKLEGALNKYREYVGTVRQDRTALLKRLDTKKSKVVNEFLSVKANIVAQLEKMEKDLKTMLDATHRQESKKIKTELEKCQEIESSVTNAKVILKLADQHGSDSQVVDSVEKVKQECEYYEENMSILCSNMKTIDYNIGLDPSLQQVVKRLSQFGRIDVHSTATTFGPTPKCMNSLGFQTNNPSAKPVTKSVKPKHTPKPDESVTKEVADFCARFSEDENECWFTGACFMPDGRIVLADRTNRKLKLFTKDYEPLVEHVMSSKPWDVTVINNKQVAVSLPAECKIQFVTVTETMLRPTRAISSEEPCFGLFFANDKILTVTYDGDPVNLKIFSLTGEELAYVCVDDDGSPLFSKPIYVTSNADMSTIYVADERQGCVVTLVESGELNFTATTIDVGHSAGLTVDKAGNLYVCDNSSNCVQQLSGNGESINVIVSGGVVSYPRAVTYDERDKRLLVTQGDQDTVKVYKLSK